MKLTETVAIQTADTKKRDIEEMIELFSKMSELNRAKVFGYAQGVESMSTANPKKTA